MKKIINLIIFILFLIAGFLVSVRALGYVPYVIKSDSMSPTYEVNDIIYIKKADFGEIEENDVITFINSNNNITTHRVIEINNDEKCVYTQGDNNEFPDVMPTYDDNIIGIVKFSIPKLGVFSIQLGEE